MIIPKLYGRLGNQCFQISAAIAHAKKIGAQWRVPRQTVDPRVWPIYFKNLPMNPRGYAAMHTYNEPRHCYDVIPLYKDMLLNGYFQSEKYFLDAKQDIGDALGFHCNKQDYIAVHIRRGDYLWYPNQFPILSINYYKTAMEFMGGITDPGYNKFRIYSDDIEWCKQVFNPAQKILDFMAFNAPLHIEFSLLKEPLTDMRDMYNAAGFIISNSTYSLFPALLRLDNPVVIAPEQSRWYGPANANLETCDLMPERFMKI